MQIQDTEMADVEIRTLHDPEGKYPEFFDSWLGWPNNVQGDGTTESV
jgi:hypothetical protein